MVEGGSVQCWMYPESCINHFGILVWTIMAVLVVLIVSIILWTLLQQEDKK